MPRKGQRKEATLSRPVLPLSKSRTQVGWSCVIRLYSNIYSSQGLACGRQQSQISRLLINTVPSFMLPDMIKGKRGKYNFNKIYIKTYIKHLLTAMSFALDLIQISFLTSMIMLVILWGSKTVNSGDTHTHIHTHKTFLRMLCQDWAKKMRGGRGGNWC